MIPAHGLSSTSAGYSGKGLNGPILDRDITDYEIFTLDPGGQSIDFACQSKRPKGRRTGNTPIFSTD